MAKIIVKDHRLGVCHSRLSTQGCCGRVPCPCEPPYVSPSWYLAGCTSFPIPGGDFRFVPNLGRVAVRYQSQGFYLLERLFPSGLRVFRRAQYNTFLQLCFRIGAGGFATETVNGYTAWTWQNDDSNIDPIFQAGTNIGAAALSAPYPNEDGTYSTCLLRPAVGLFRPYAPTITPEAAGLIGNLRIDCEPATVPLPNGLILWEARDSPTTGTARALDQNQTTPTQANGYHVRHVYTFTATWARDLSCRAPGEGGGEGFLPPGIDPATLRPVVPGCPGCGN